MRSLIKASLRTRPEMSSLTMGYDITRGRRKIKNVTFVNKKGHYDGKGWGDDTGSENDPIGFECGHGW